MVSFTWNHACDLATFIFHLSLVYMVSFTWNHACDLATFIFHVALSCLHGVLHLESRM
ncbi:hypothetical protein F383_36468 [Gossypium arboreum]|uniref:Uncharacterized protein n=1 Tax=Gossypium arboreum TaxID=29729 RepID=A0A0B0NBR2_GOSAR|nr:hypothetical protein F383_37155 [Gossypium arboreum]KHG10255.1 hypothetical protein F383_11519 [Gossypium arboreum]KHG13222.1 hypothetical protein F383_01220 [Gossypium arboreum]KHG18928.1 hypothetical protein F383_26305 [Gossypium arboreum]KHG19132.1 hypothetical protein F383_25552 [Gossypium arboreum]